jgi:hypothetical protein
MMGENENHLTKEVSWFSYRPTGKGEDADTNSPTQRFAVCSPDSVAEFKN